MPVKLYLSTCQEIKSLYSGMLAEGYLPRDVGMTNEGSVVKRCPSMDFALAEDVGFVPNPSAFEDVTAPIDLGVLRQDGVAVHSAIGRGYSRVGNPCIPAVG